MFVIEIRKGSTNGRRDQCLITFLSLSLCLSIPLSMYLQKQNFLLENSLSSGFFTSKDIALSAMPFSLLFKERESRLLVSYSRLDQRRVFA